MAIHRKACWIAFAAIMACIALGSPAIAQDAENAEVAAVGQIDGDYGWRGVPDVSVHGHEIDRLINLLHWFMGIMFVLWTGLLLYFLVRYRQREGHKARYHVKWKRIHLYFVIGFAAFELVLDVGYSNPVLARVKNEVPDEADAVVVRVMGEQFAWNFRYAGEDGVFGKSAPEFIDDATNPLGLDPDDPHGEDDIVSASLHVPTGKPVICQISSKDVIHSFSIPVLRVKQDAIPGMRIPTWFEARKTGRYQVACAQLCGNNHYSMKAPLVIESPEAFATWKIAQATEEEFDEDAFED